MILNSKLNFALLPAFLISLFTVFNSINAQNDIVEIYNNHLRAKIALKGAEIISLFDKTDSIEYIWQGSDESWKKHSPILFPFVGKIKGGFYKITGKKYKMKNHGFASRKIFKISEQSLSKLVLVLESNPSTLKIYPFKFRLTVCYSLEGNELKVTNTVENIDTKNIFFSIGAHPGFNIPFVPNEKFEDYFIEFDTTEVADRIVLSKPKGYPTDSLLRNYLGNGNILPLNHDLFLDRVIILRGLKSKTLTIRSKNSKRGIRVKGIDKFPYLGIWTFVKKDEPFVCIEPWYGISDYVNSSGEIAEKTGIQSLESGKVFKMKYSIEIQK